MLMEFVNYHASFALPSLGFQESVCIGGTTTRYGVDLLAALAP